MNSSISLGAVFLGAAPGKWDEASKEVRRELGLPIKKDLIYYTSALSADTACNVREFRVSEIYNDSNDMWCVLEVTLATGETRKIHSSFLLKCRSRLL